MPSVDSHVPAPPAVLPPAYPDRAAWGTASKLRAWQAEALKLYLDKRPKDFLAVATPGAGKTTFALTVAAELLQRRLIEPITLATTTRSRSSPTNTVTTASPGARRTTRTATVTRCATT